MPALDRGWVQDVLTHIADTQRQAIETGLGEGELADHACGADHRLDRALDPGKAGVLEEVRVEQEPQHGANVVIGPEVLRLELLDRCWILRRGMLPGRYLRLIGNEEIVQVP